MKPISTLLIITGLFLFSIPLLYAQAETADGYTEFLNLAYVSGKDADSSYHKLNLVIPKGKSNVPLLLWIGGGAWSYVDRHQEMNFAHKMARQGIAVASVGHRLSPATWKDPSYTSGITHPEHIKDVSRAFKWLYDHATEYGYSPASLFVGGYSSGGHLAALLSLDTRYLKAAGCAQDQIKGVIPVAGTYDIPHYYQILAGADGQNFADSHVKGVFGNSQEDFIDASPTTYLKNWKVPMLLISDVNTYRYTKFFEDQIKAKGYKDFQVLHIEELNHSQLWKHLSFEEESKYRELIIRFMKSYTTF